jgi:hypothetical protein
MVAHGRCAVRRLRQCMARSSARCARALQIIVSVEATPSRYRHRPGPGDTVPLGPVDVAWTAGALKKPQDDRPQPAEILTDPASINIWCFLSDNRSAQARYPTHVHGRYALRTVEGAKPSVSSWTMADSATRPVTPYSSQSRPRADPLTYLIAANVTIIFPEGGTYMRINANANIVQPDATSPPTSPSTTSNDQYRDVGRTRPRHSHEWSWSRRQLHSAVVDGPLDHFR